MEALKRGDRVRVVLTYGNRPWSRHTGELYEVVLVDGVYVQLFGGKWPRTFRYHAASVEDLGRREVALRPAHDATTPGWGESIRVRRES